LNLIRVRTIIIAALLLLNVAFAAFWYIANSEITKIPSEMLNNAVKNLNSSGVSVKTKTIPAKVPNHVIYSYEVLPVPSSFNKENTKYKYSDQLSAFFLPKSSLKTGEQSEMAYFDIPEGFSISMNILKKGGKQSEYASITCSGDFGFEYQGLIST